MIIISDPEIVRDIYTTKDSIIDKEQIMALTFRELFGDSIVLAPSDEKWKKNRKVVSSCFYK